MYPYINLLTNGKQVYKLNSFIHCNNNLRTFVITKCFNLGPGPVYKLPSLVGHVGHDPSKRRGPAYSIRYYVGLEKESVGPGPRYNIQKLTKFGIDKPPAYTIAIKYADPILDLGPGPGAYSPEQCLPMNHSRRAPAYSIKSKGQALQILEGPGPNAYTIPTCIGSKIPDKRAQAAYTIGGYYEPPLETLSPGPAAYANLDPNIVKKRNPMYSFKWRHELPEDYLSPGPRYNPTFNTGRRAPKFSFGVRHSECAGNPITSLDED
ncbi:PREDICTED: outer dense fiber protein 3-like [Polistes canadensis]|uniref:outer dense fiber protein 3-like n=1 Tax=Polistes canadensis TaxID=91411 RepID=UPI000718B1F5|nr:PREDICTED: outer dense fiber protein 3-like [Polistes canadensis]